ncbi:hypothetical protein [uncultured Thiodictyon sp.]|uniref:hypothetical protein n=1 Tax=uncultured Thiodictyon sp. TaxID=1846217 RepID=UPI0025F8F421|nr:hypothetical protein [uncultured Thiodictyon sp.]
MVGLFDYDNDNVPRISVTTSVLIAPERAARLARVRGLRENRGPVDADRDHQHRETTRCV